MSQKKGQYIMIDVYGKVLEETDGDCQEETNYNHYDYLSIIDLTKEIEDQDEEVLKQIIKLLE